MSRGSYTYSVWTPTAPPLASHPTSRTEVIHVLIAFLVLTVDFVIILSGRGLLYGGGLSGLFAPLPLYFLLLALAAALTGFIAHEMAHKLVARRLGYWAEFRMWPTGLFLSLITASAGFVFAAPGATIVDGMDPRDVRKWGQTGVAGPASNLLFATGFYLASLATFRVNLDLSGALLFLAYINSAFAAFNLLPLGPLDGAKVFRWGAARWASAFALAVVAFGITISALTVYGTPFLVW
jgi:Zn-dependent protease